MQDWKFMKSWQLPRSYCKVYYFNLYNLQEVISRTDTDREGVFKSLQSLFAIRHEYMELVKALADQSDEVIEECRGFIKFLGT